MPQLFVEASEWNMNALKNDVKRLVLETFLLFDFSLGHLVSDRFWFLYTKDSIERLTKLSG